MKLTLALVCHWMAARYESPTPSQIVSKHPCPPCHGHLQSILQTQTLKNQYRNRRRLPHPPLPPQPTQPTPHLPPLLLPSLLRKPGPGRAARDPRGAAQVGAQLGAQRGARNPKRLAWPGVGWLRWGDFSGFCGGFMVRPCRWFEFFLVLCGLVVFGSCGGLWVVRPLIQYSHLGRATGQWHLRGLDRCLGPRLEASIYPTGLSGSLPFRICLPTEHQQVTWMLNPASWLYPRL